MKLTAGEIDSVIRYVREEPRTVQDISRLLKISWVTADTYLKRIKDDTGMIGIKTFRQGTQGALKIVYYENRESAQGDSVREKLLSGICAGKRKNDFDFFEVFQFIPEKEKSVVCEEYADNYMSKSRHFVQSLRKAIGSVYLFSGNMSFINLAEGKATMIDILEELLKRKVAVKVVCRIDVASLKNISKVLHLLATYPSFEIRHCYQPLRGMIIDNDFAVFTSELKSSEFQLGELPHSMQIYYYLRNPAWIAWLERVFWGMFRTSISCEARVRQIKRYMI